MQPRYFLFLLAVVLYVIGCSGRCLPPGRVPMRA